MEVEWSEGKLLSSLTSKKAEVKTTGCTKVSKTKPFTIERQLVMDACLKVKANRGNAGVDEMSLEEFDKDYKSHLYRIWNRMSSGSYIPPPVTLVEIPKKDGGVRPLDTPTVADRTAQAVVAGLLEEQLDPVFHEDSYGYRPGKSAYQALARTRVRCWKCDWVVDLDIRSFFDNLPHDLLMKAVRRHTDYKWILLYIERWLVAPVQKIDGTVHPRTKRVPQGSVIGPILSNLYLHYTLDIWLVEYYPECDFERYADDAIIHCHSESTATEVLEKLGERMKTCGLTLHPEKTKIVYCKDSNRTGTYSNVTFDFLDYTFMPRMAQNSTSKEWLTNFLPAVSKKSMSKMNSVLKRFSLFRATTITLNDISEKINPMLRGWINYYGKFYKSKLQSFMHVTNLKLARWARRKYKYLRTSEMKAIRWLHGITKAMPNLFAHWKLGALPTLPNENKLITGAVWWKTITYGSYRVLG
jgi:RNA-directed DNA polymerase